MSRSINRLSRQKKLSLITIGAVYLLILVGGIVRSTGSGMGCPDWPKCFGSWVPPTSVEQLPENYKEIYSENRHQKNLRFANYLDVMGLEQVSDKLRNDPSVREEADFNPLKTWIEYINRLIGVVIGFLILLNFVHAVKLKKQRPIVFWLALLALVGVVFQGWIGSIVVSTNLLPGMISFHMLLALLIVVFLLGVYHFSATSGTAWKLSNRTLLMGLIIGSVVIFLVQMLVGVSIRESVDSALAADVDRGAVLELAGGRFLFHRSFSWLLLITHLYIVYILWKNEASGKLSSLAVVLGVLVGLEIASGAALGYLALPAFVQPLHLLFASLIFGFQIYLFLLISQPVHQTQNSIE